MPRFNWKIISKVSAAAIALACPIAGQAQTVSMTGLVVNLCVLSLSTSGTLVSSPTGAQLTTTDAGGVPALLTVVAAGTNPTVRFSAPTITGPSASTSTVELAFNSLGGAVRPFATGAYVAPLNQLLDSITIHGRISNPNGFSGGSYTVSSTATCSQ